LAWLSCIDDVAKIIKLIIADRKKSELLFIVAVNAAVCLPMNQKAFGKEFFLFLNGCFLYDVSIEKM
jgi:hypothetical protein